MPLSVRVALTPPSASLAQLEEHRTFNARARSSSLRRRTTFAEGAKPMIQTLYPPFRHWSEKGTIWLYSDTHFGDRDLKRAFPDRPDDETHVGQINRKCGRKDTLILLGDVGDIEIAKKLRGYKVLICGNHDLGHTAYETVFDEVYSGPLFISPRILLSHEPVNLRFAFNIHGHDHKNRERDPFHLNVCSDVIGYSPINFNRLIKSGRLSAIPTIHRITIDEAAARANNR